MFLFQSYFCLFVENINIKARLNKECLSNTTVMPRHSHSILNLSVLVGFTFMILVGLVRSDLNEKVMFN